MTTIGSWKFWVIIALALGTLACAGRRERREQAREERRERAEQRRADRQEQAERRRAERERAQQEQVAEAPRQAEPAAPPPTRQTAAAAFTPVAAPVTAAAAAASSKVVFMRVSKQTSGTDAALFDVTDSGTPKFIGMVGASSKISYPLNPGLYTFMVVGETAEFMQANIAGGKTYYALVIPKAGAKRYAIEPVRQNEIGGKEFVSWDHSTRPMSGGAQAYSGDATDKRSRHWPEWVRKAESERAELTINAEDGR